MLRQALGSFMGGWYDDVIAMVPCLWWSYPAATLQLFCRKLVLQHHPDKHPQNREAFLWQNLGWEIGPWVFKKVVKRVRKSDWTKQLCTTLVSYMFFFFEILSLSRIPVPFLGRKTICNRFVIQKELERSTIAQSIGNFSLKVFPPKKSLFGPIFSKIRLPGPNGHVWQAPSSFYSMTFVFSSVDI